MFGFKAAEEEVRQAESESFDEGTVKSDTGAFSFFGFNLFEADETLQYDDDESIKEEKLVKDTIPTVEESFDSAIDSKTGPKRAFWYSHGNSRNVDNEYQIDNGEEPKKGVGVMTKIKGNLSRTLTSIKHAELNLAERIRSTSKRTGKIFDRSHSKEVDKYETRDDLERNHRTSYVDSFDSTSIDAYDERLTSDKKCFPSWPLKKISATARDMEPMGTIQETESIGTQNSRSLAKRDPPDKYVVHHTPSHQHPHHHPHHRPSSGTVGTPRHSSKKSTPRRYVNTIPSKPLRTNGTYVKPSNYDDNIWDDQSTSSGWFSLESLDAR